MLISFFLMIIISTSLTVRGQLSPRFHVEAWLPFRNCEMDYCIICSKKYLEGYAVLNWQLIDNYSLKSW